MSKRDDWWYSGDGRMGFCWKAVTGYHWIGGQNGFPDTLYLYSGGGILRIHGGDSAKVYDELRARAVKKPDREAAP